MQVPQAYIDLLGVLLTLVLEAFAVITLYRSDRSNHHE